MARKILSGILIVFGATLTMLSVVAIATIWVYNEPLTVEATSRLNDVNTELTQAQVGLQSSEQELQRALRILDASEAALEKLSNQSDSAGNILENIQGTLDDQLIPELKTTRERLVSARTTLETLRNTISGFGSFLSLDLEAPNKVLNDLIDSTKSLDTEISNIQGIAQQASTFVGDSSFLLDGDLSETRASLESFLDTIHQYEDKVSEWRRQVVDLIDKTPHWINQASIILTIFLLWFAVSQVGLLLHGVNMRRGYDPFVSVRRGPVSLVEQIREDGEEEVIIVEEIIEE